jgi:hypothetical protein
VKGRRSTFRPLVVRFTVIAGAMLTFALVLEMLSQGYAHMSGIPALGTLEYSWIPQSFVAFIGWTFVSWMIYGQGRVNGDLRAFWALLFAFFGPIACYQLEGAIPEVLYAHRSLLMMPAVPAVMWKIPRYYSRLPGHSGARYTHSRA